MNPAKQQIRQSVSCMYGTFLFCAFWLLAAALSPDSRMIFIAVASLSLLYGLLSARNDRLTYDETGITLYSIWGKPFHKTWDDIQRVDVAEEPLISKQLFVGRVLRIRCEEKNCTHAVTYRFPYRYYVGIDEFLSFYDSLTANQQ